MTFAFPVDSGCVSCARGFYEECGHAPPIELPQVLGIEKRHGNVKDDSEVTISAGRKRAAKAYLVDPTMDCEWRGLANCGGGVHPIIGCINGIQRHRHHGPVKNTTHNERTNIHLICARCHNTWHAKNDPDYIEDVNEVLPHAPIPVDDKRYEIRLKKDKDD